MKHLDLTFESRLKLTSLLANATGPLAKITSLQHIWLQTRFNDAELAQILKVDIGGGLTNFQPPSPEFGGKSIALEESYAAVLLQEIEACQSFRVADVAWLEDVTRQLKG